MINVKWSMENVNRKAGKEDEDGKGQELHQWEMD